MAYTITRRSALGVLFVSATGLAACAGLSTAGRVPQAAAETPGQLGSATTPASASGSASQLANSATPVSAGSAASAPTAAIGSSAAPITPLLNPGVVSWVHIGDMHITTADQQNYKDLQAIIAHTNQYLKNGINFAYVSGDNANDDTAAEYQLIKDAFSKLQVPYYFVPGDHDSKDGQVLYRQYLEAKRYYSFSMGGYHFAFLDMLDASGHGGGGFGIGSTQMSWLQQDLAAAKSKGERILLFGHTYDIASLGSSGQQLQQLIEQDGVIMLDAGHTHYNDVANDGHTVYATGRNTGQVTEGPVGFVIVNIDHGGVSWKFKPLGSWPFVMITNPVDKVLITDPSQAVKGTVEVRAKVWDDKGVASATMQVDGGTAATMARIGTTQMWKANVDASKLQDGDHKVSVKVQGAGGNTSVDEVAFVVQNSGSYVVPQRQPGASGNSVGVYTEKGLLGNHTVGGPGGGPKGGPGGRGPKGSGGPGPKGPGGRTATITAINGETLTLQFPDGTTEHVTIANGASLAKVVPATTADLKAGEKVGITLTSNGTGSKAISTIEIEPS